MLSSGLRRSTSRIHKDQHNTSSEIISDLYSRFLPVYSHGPAPSYTCTYCWFSYGRASHSLISGSTGSELKFRLVFKQLCMEEAAVTFLVQFMRFRRGVPEVIRTLSFATVDGAAALTFARSLAGTRHWPARTSALRVMDDGGRTLLDWTVPATSPQPDTNSRTPVPAEPTGYELRASPQ